MGSGPSSTLATGLTGKKVLLVEDEAIIAIDLEQELIAHGALVLGPCSDSQHAFALLSNEVVDIAVLDVDLNGTECLDVADRLADLKVPFVFHTGHASRYELGDRYPGVAIFSKPTLSDKLIAEIAKLSSASG